MLFSRRSFLGMAASGVAGCMVPGRVCAESLAMDDNLSVIFSDAHVSAPGTPAARCTPRRLAAFVDEVLAMRPLPRRVIHLGDLALHFGLAEDYAVSKPMLKRLEAAGIELVFCMGNHDRRSEFDKAWPGHLAKSPVPGRFVSVTSLGTADLVILDGLQGTDDRPLNDMGPGSGKLSREQIVWLKKELPRRERPFFVASHFQIGDLRITDRKFGDLGSWIVGHAPMCVGYLNGHIHRWRPEWIHGPWKNRRTLRTLSIPSNGLWGDIGHVTLRTGTDRAVCSLVLKDFYFPSEPDTAERPAPWRLKIEETRGQTCTFLYDRQGV